MTSHARTHLAVGLVLGALLIGVWVTESFGLFPHVDAVAHLLGGVALTLYLTSVTERADTTILAGVCLLAVLWEPLEAWYFGVDLAAWMLKEDTLFDISLAFVGSACTLIGLGRYR